MLNVVAELRLLQSLPQVSELSITPMSAYEGKP